MDAVGVLLLVADGTRTKRTPAMAAGIADHVWTLRDIAALLDTPPISN